MTDEQIRRRFAQLREFCEVLVMGSDTEALDILAETYPEIWLGFVHELEGEDILCDHDDLRFRKALAGLIGTWIEE